MPHASVARQVRVALKLWPQLALVMVLTMEMLFVPQASFALGASNVHGAVHSTVFAATQAIAGGVVSTTVMVCVQDD